MRCRRRLRHNYYLHLAMSTKVKVHKSVFIQVRASSVLRMWLLLLLLVKGPKRDSGYLDDLESYSRNISHGMTGTTKSRNQNFVVFVDVIQTTITRDEGRNLLSVLDELHANTLSDSTVGLLGLDTNLLQNNSLGHRGASHRIRFHGRNGILLTVFQIMPTLIAAMSSELTTRVDTTWLSHGNQ
jgi:hypothetical protein